ncbi:MAG: LamG-like jellyroll fold domain-containing protein [Blastocatellia bacterium]
MPNPIITRRAVNRKRPAIFDKMVAYWTLGEASGPRVDLANNFALADNATVTQADGKIGKAAQFTRANSEFLSVGDNPTLSLGSENSDKFSLALWVYFDSLTVNQILAAKNDGASWEFDLILANAGTLGVFLEITGQSTGYTFVGQTPTINTATWYFVYIQADGATIGISIDNAALSTTAFTGALIDSTSAFKIGASGVGNYMDGRIQHVTLWKGRVLTQAERDWLWNAGRGRDLSLYLR